MKNYEKTDEKIFAQIKVDIVSSHIRINNELTTDGKTFVTFVASILSSYMSEKLTSYLAANLTSMRKTFSQLSNIVTIYADGEPFRLIHALIKMQKDVVIRCINKNQVELRI